MRQEDCYELQASLGCTVISRPAQSIEYRDTTSKGVLITIYGVGSVKSPQEKRTAWA